MAFQQPPRFSNLIVFDIESVPETNYAQELCDLTDEQVKSMNQVELRDAMTKYHEDKYNNPFLRQTFHRVACISFLKAKIEYNEFGEEYYTFDELNTYSSFKDGEEKCVRAFWNLLKTSNPRIISFNGRTQGQQGFDMALLKCKALKYGIDIGWYYKLGGKWDGYERSDDAHTDMHTAGGFGSYTLHEMCISLGIPCKLGVDGSKVADYYDIEEKHIDIREYCETDVLATYLFYLRYAFIRGLINKNSYNKNIYEVENHLINTTKKGLKEFLEEWHRLNPSGLVLK